MSQINPFTASALQTGQVARQQATDKSRQARRRTEQQKNAAARDDQLDHQVENTDELSAIHDEARSRPDRRKPPPRDLKQEDEVPDDQPARLDLKA